MPTTVLQLVQDFTEKMGLPTPAALVGVQEKSVRQIRALLREVIEQCAEFRWQQQTLRMTFLSVAGQDQGSMTTIFGPGYHGIVQNSIWNQTRKMRVYGPVSPQIWQALQTLPNAGPQFQCWISNDHLYVSPAFVANETIAVMYETKLCVLAVNGTTTKERITSDDDSILFPDSVIRKGLEAAWRQQKGEIGWEDIRNTFIGLLAKNLVRDGAPVLSMSPGKRGAQPGIVIPAGSWNL